MSEPSSLCLRVRLSEPKFAAFMHSPLVSANAYSDWQAWLSSQKFYGEITDAEIERISPHDPAETVSEANLMMQNLYSEVAGFGDDV